MGGYSRPLLSGSERKKQNASYVLMLLQHQIEKIPNVLRIEANEVREVFPKIKSKNSLSVPSLSEIGVESTNPHWASVVDYGLNPVTLWEETRAL
ncbi:jg27378 [Pararge aegeria aegeria]|uniref:Jg27378 protein n=1 Tax=Pararge aegeria aegeria TaxID=348720 RepID=A0A8S4QUV7_9NEOP|nr:jg27378 [Pararge aegeria aegeria]